MSDPSPELTFDRATYASPTGASAASVAPCGGCKQPLTDQYWKWHRLLVCKACRDGLEAKLRETQSSAVFGKAFVQGGGVALACGVGYAVFVATTNTQFALVTIGIAIAVAHVIRKATSGLSGRRFQVLAAVLTYVASTMGYAPALYHAALHGHDAGAISLFGYVYLAGIMLAAPFLELTEAPLGVVIIAIGVWSAWSRTRAVPLQIEGPFRVAPPAAAPQAPAPQADAPQADAPPAT
jgi:hypothetical protein